MPENLQCYPDWVKNKQYCKFNPDGPSTDGMGKGDRKQLVLEFLAHHGLALPPAVLWRNLRLKHNATFSEKSLDNYLRELEGEGMVRRVDPAAMEQRELAPPDSGRGYWLPTDCGRQQAGESFSFS